MPKYQTLHLLVEDLLSGILMSMRDIDEFLESPEQKTEKEKNLSHLLSIGIREQMYPLVSYLLEKGADPFLEDDEGISPLVLILRKGYFFHLPEIFWKKYPFEKPLFEDLKSWLEVVQTGNSILLFLQSHPHFIESLKSQPSLRKQIWMAMILDGRQNNYTVFRLFLQIGSKMSDDYKICIQDLINEYVSGKSEPKKRLIRNVLIELMNTEYPFKFSIQECLEFGPAQSLPETHTMIFWIYLQENQQKPILMNFIIQYPYIAESLLTNNRCFIDFCLIGIQFGRRQKASEFNVFKELVLFLKNNYTKVAETNLELMLFNVLVERFLKQVGNTDTTYLLEVIKIVLDQFPQLLDQVQPISLLTVYDDLVARNQMQLVNLIVSRRRVGGANASVANGGTISQKKAGVCFDIKPLSLKGHPIVSGIETLEVACSSKINECFKKCQMYRLSLNKDIQLLVNGEGDTGAEKTERLLAQQAEEGLGHITQLKQIWEHKYALTQNKTVYARPYFLIMEIQFLQYIKRFGDCIRLIEEGYQWCCGEWRDFFESEDEKKAFDRKLSVERFLVEWGEETTVGDDLNGKSLVVAKNGLDRLMVKLECQKRQFISENEDMVGFLFSCLCDLEMNISHVADLNFSIKFILLFQKHGYRKEMFQLGFLFAKKMWKEENFFAATYWFSLVFLCSEDEVNIFLDRMIKIEHLKEAISSAERMLENLMQVDKKIEKDFPNYILIMFCLKNLSDFNVLLITEYQRMYQDEQKRISDDNFVENYFEQIKRFRNFSKYYRIVSEQLYLDTFFPIFESMAQFLETNINDVHAKYFVVYFSSLMWKVESYDFDAILKNDETRVQLQADIQKLLYLIDCFFKKRIQKSKDLLLLFLEFEDWIKILLKKVPLNASEDVFWNVMILTICFGRLLNNNIYHRDSVKLISQMLLDNHAVINREIKIFLLSVPKSLNEFIKAIFDKLLCEINFNPPSDVRMNDQLIAMDLLLGIYSCQLLSKQFDSMLENFLSQNFGEWMFLLGKLDLKIQESIKKQKTCYPVLYFSAFYKIIIKIYCCLKRSGNEFESFGPIELLFNFYRNCGQEIESATIALHEIGVDIFVQAFNQLKERSFTHSESRRQALFLAEAIRDFFGLLLLDKWTSEVEERSNLLLSDVDKPVVVEKSKKKKLKRKKKHLEVKKKESESDENSGSDDPPTAISSEKTSPKTQSTESSEKPVVATDLDNLSDLDLSQGTEGRLLDGLDTEVGRKQEEDSLAQPMRASQVFQDLVPVCYLSSPENIRIVFQELGVNRVMIVGSYIWHAIYKEKIKCELSSRPSDVDFITDVSADVLERHFPRGKKPSLNHYVYINQEGVKYDFSLVPEGSLSQEGYASFLLENVSRRDFTCNALLLAADGNVFDLLSIRKEFPQSGYQDILGRRINAVVQRFEIGEDGEKKGVTRLEDDPFCGLRGVRLLFHSIFGENVRSNRGLYKRAKAKFLRALEQIPQFPYEKGKDAYKFLTEFWKHFFVENESEEKVQPIQILLQNLKQLWEFDALSILIPGCPKATEKEAFDTLFSPEFIERYKNISDQCKKTRCNTALYVFAIICGKILEKNIRQDTENFLLQYASIGQIIPEIIERSFLKFLSIEMEMEWRGYVCSSFLVPQVLKENPGLFLMKLLEYLFKQNERCIGQCMISHVIENLKELCQAGLLFFLVPGFPCHLKDTEQEGLFSDEFMRRHFYFYENLQQCPPHYAALFVISFLYSVVIQRLFKIEEMETQGVNAKVEDMIRESIFRELPHEYKDALKRYILSELSMLQNPLVRMPSSLLMQQCGMFGFSQGRECSAYELDRNLVRYTQAYRYG